MAAYIIFPPPCTNSLGSEILRNLLKCPFQWKTYITPNFLNLGRDEITESESNAHTRGVEIRLVSPKTGDSDYVTLRSVVVITFWMVQHYQINKSNQSGVSGFYGFLTWIFELWAKFTIPKEQWGGYKQSS